MEGRLKTIEITIERHDSQITKLFSRVDGISKTLTCIQKTLDQIKWLFFGGLGYFVITEMGILAAIKVVA